MVILSLSMTLIQLTENMEIEMTDTDIQKLKAAALAATPGPWFVQFGDDERHQCMTAISAVNARTDNDCMFTDQPLIAVTFHQSYPLVNMEGDDCGDLNSAYIAAANPAAILDLIAAVERAQAAPFDIEAKLRQAFDLGQTYYQQLDSTDGRENLKVSATADKLGALIADAQAEQAAPYADPRDFRIEGRSHDGKSPDVHLPIFGDGSSHGKRLFVVALPPPEAAPQVAAAQIAPDQP